MSGRWAVAVLAVILACALARADEPKRLGVGLYAPSAPFEGPEARLAYVTGLAEELATRAGRPFVGRVFARAADLAAAVKKGEVQLVVVDAPNASSLGAGFDVIGLAVRSAGAGGSQVTWELVATDAVRDLRDLRGKTVAVPATSGHEAAFLHNALLENEVPPGYFGKITAAPDALSAAAAVSVGRADAAVVPGGLALPAGVHRVAALRDLPWPALALAPGVDDATRRAVVAALPGLRTAGIFARFEPAPGAPTLSFAIEPTELTPLIEAPGRR